MISNIRDKIRHTFNKSCHTYDQNAHVQSAVCVKLLDLLTSVRCDFSIAADFACGTGISTAQLIKQFKFKKLYAVDISSDLIQVAAQKLPPDILAFIVADYNNVEIPESSLDLIFCNMGYQWSMNLAETLKHAWHRLKHDGLLVFSIPMEGSFCELQSTARNAFHHSTSILEMLEISSFSLLSFNEEVINESFISQIEALRSIKKVGANYLINSNRKRFSRHFFIHPQETSLTYRIGLFCAMKR